MCEQVPNVVVQVFELGEHVAWAESRQDGTVCPAAVKDCAVRQLAVALYGASCLGRFLELLRDDEDGADEVVVSALRVLKRGGLRCGGCRGMLGVDQGRKVPGQGLD